MNEKDFFDDFIVSFGVGVGREMSREGQVSTINKALSKVETRP
jgi:hypothetical protein